MSTRNALVGRLGRLGTSPIRRYFNAHFEAMKEEQRVLAAETRRAATVDDEHLRVAIGRLEEAIGFLGLQLATLRSDLDAERAAAGRAAAGDAE